MSQSVATKLKEHEYILSSKFVIHELDTGHTQEFTNASLMRSDATYMQAEYFGKDGILI